jgi:exodeoxyribonuclease V gamma subunit
MFRLITSNDAATLADGLGQSLAGARGNPLVPARVLVPQAGLKRWLQVHLAETRGVLANVEFTPPAQFAWELLRAARPDLPQASPFDVEVLRWHVYALLGEPLDGEPLAPLREYLARDNDPLRRYGLSFELARAFERMEGYRRKRLLAWERGAAGGDWQAELWRRLLPRVGGASRAARVDAWLQEFDPEDPFTRSAAPAPPGLPGRLACFACANVSPDVLRMLAVAGRHCDVDFFLPLPSGAYLGDTPTTRREIRERLRQKDGGNPLITSLGGAAAEFLELLYGYGHVQPDDEIDLFEETVGTGTLLGRVRNDILQHVTPCEANRVAAPDESLQFHACHTPLREVQVLHDTLLALLDRHPDLQPRDIAVMMPDVATYRPAIDAVFGGLERDDSRFLPYNLGDLGAAAQHPAAELFLKLLDAPSSRWELDELVDVLSAPGAMRRFDLDGDAVERLARRLRDAGARWGEDEHARERVGAGRYREFSWAFAIDRIVAGFATGDEPDVLVGDTAPLAGVEGQAFAHLDAALAVTETWRRLGEESRRPRQPAAWQALLNEALDALYQPDPNDLAETRALERVRAALADLVEHGHAADAALELPWTDLRAYLRDALAAPDPAQRLFTGGVTFCGMVPLRVVPFRVICLLGMDEAAFPRRDPGGLDPLVADRRAGDSKLGDRDVRADDRLLFLQLLAAARDVFYVSWIGRDARTNKPLPPAVVVAELRDLVRDHYLLPVADEDARRARDARLTQVAPLHPFSATLFGSGNAPPCSYRHEWLPAAGVPARPTASTPPFVAQALPAPAEIATALELAELARFFDDPARGFLERALQLRLPRAVDEDANLEPLQPDHPLLRYDLARALLEHDASVLGEETRLLRAQGRLPPAELAEAALAGAGRRAALLGFTIESFTGGQPPLADVAATLELADGTRLAGKVSGIYAAGLVRWSPGGFKGRRVVRAWLDTLFVACATGTPRLCRFLWIEKDVVQRRDIAVADPTAALAQLGRLVASWREGECAPLPLFPDASAEAFKLKRQKGPCDMDEDRTEFMEKLADIAAKADEDGAFSDAQDFDKPSVRLAWRGVPISVDDETLAARLHAAAREHFPRLEPVAKDAP